MCCSLCWWGGVELERLGRAGEDASNPSGRTPSLVEPHWSNVEAKRKMKPPCILAGLLLTLSPLLAVKAATDTAGACAKATATRRRARFWVGANGAGGVAIVNRTTNASCTASFLSNLTRYAESVDSLGFEVWRLSASSGEPAVAFGDGTSRDDGLAACVAQLREKFPHVRVGLCGAVADDSALSTAASQPAAYVSALQNFTAGVGFHVDEIWTDMEVKSLSPAEREGANAMHALSQSLWPTFRYAGCEPRDAPYFSENCSSFVRGAPGVVVQASNTYWSTTVSTGWYGGFAKVCIQLVRAWVGGALACVPCSSLLLFVQCLLPRSVGGNSQRKRLSN